jgi:hypothetical protein
MYLKPEVLLQEAKETIARLEEIIKKSDKRKKQLQKRMRKRRIDFKFNKA